jgi:hypothetical protein
MTRSEQKKSVYSYMPCFALASIRCLRQECKKPGFSIPVKKTYLTLMYLTRVSTNVCRGFVVRKNPFREAVEFWPLLLKWKRMKNVSHRFTQMNTDKFALSSNGWPFNQLARQGFLGRHSPGSDGRSVFICVYLWLKCFGRVLSRFDLFRPVSTKKIKPVSGRFQAFQGDSSQKKKSTMGHRGGKAEEF